jgi:hypothetical protein
MTAETPTPEDLIAPACRPTVERLQSMLDGELEATAVDADAHPAVCAACRERVAVAKLMLSVLANPEAVAVPAGLTERIVEAVKEDRYTRIRRRSYVGAVGVIAALAASLMLIAWVFEKPPEKPVPLLPRPLVQKEPPEVAPAPREVTPKPFRIGDELSKAGLALRVTPKSITEPASAAPEMFAKLTDAITRPISPMPEEAEPEPARSTLAELPEVARAGLEPLTDTAQKAFTRLIRDVGTVSVKPVQ